MNLALCLESFRVDGTVGLFLRIARHFIGDGHRVRAFGADGPLARSFYLAGAHVNICNGLARGSSQAMQDVVAELGSAFQAEKPDAILAVAERPFPVAAAAAADSVPTFYFLLSSDLFATTEGPLVVQAAAAGRVLALSILDAREHADHFRFEATDVLICPIPIEPSIPFERLSVRKELGIENEEVVALTIARLDVDRIASIPPFLAAIRRLRQSGLRIRAVVVGDGTHASKMRALADSEVIFTGTLLDLEGAYAAADIYCGEGTTKHEATVRAIPTLVTAAQARLGVPDRLLHLNGIQSSNTTSIEPCSIIPTMSFESALTLVATDLERFKRLASHAAERILLEHESGRFMRWLGDVLCGNCHSVIPVAATAGEALVIDAEREQFLHAAEKVRFEPERYALRSRGLIPWGWFCDLDPACWGAVANSARRDLIRRGRTLPLRCRGRFDKRDVESRTRDTE